MAQGPGEFQNEYPSWRMWLDSESPGPYTARDNLLVSVRAIAALIPDLKVSTDEPHSDVIAVSGNPALLSALRERLRGHPLLARITEGTCARCSEAQAGRAEPVPRDTTSLGQLWRRRSTSATTG